MLAVWVTACTPAADEPTTTSSTTATTVDVTTTSTLATTTTLPTTTSTTSSTTTTTVALAADCPPAGGTPWQEQATARAERVQERADLTVDVVAYPHPGYEGRPWSQWGQGIVLPDGRFLSAVGDHRGPDGNSYLFVYDPEAGTHTRIADVLSLVDHDDGDWGYGKIHAQMVAGPCSDVFVATYWGTRRGLEYGGSYEGDLLLHVNPVAETVTNLGVALPRRGVPSMAGSADGRLLYLEGVDPFDKGGAFGVYDTLRREMVAVHEIPGHTGFRALLVDAEGGVLVSTGDGTTARYHPGRDQVESGPRLPGAVLRAATPPGPDGSAVIATNDPPVFATVSPAGVDALGGADGYTTSLAMTADGSTVYSIPHAHGGAWEEGTPIRVLDVDTGRLSTLVELQPLVGRPRGLRLGGTYSIAHDPQRNRLFVGINAGQAEDDESFGTVVLVVVELP